MFDFQKIQMFQKGKAINKVIFNRILQCKCDKGVDIIDKVAHQKRNVFKILVFTFLFLFILISNLHSQNSFKPKGKYCGGFDMTYYCIKFKKNGKYHRVGWTIFGAKTTRGYGKWEMLGDTIICSRKVDVIYIPHFEIRRVVDSDYDFKYYYDSTSHSLKGLYFDDFLKEYVIGRALTPSR